MGSEGGARRGQLSVLGVSRRRRGSFVLGWCFKEHNSVNNTINTNHEASSQEAI